MPSTVDGYRPTPRSRFLPSIHSNQRFHKDVGAQEHNFRTKSIRKPRPCHVCHQPIHIKGSICRVCKYICHPACEAKETNDLSRYADAAKTIHALWGLKGLVPIRHLEDGQSGCLHSNDGTTRSTPKKKPTPLVSAPKPTPKMDRIRKDMMDLSYVTERIIALWFPEGCNSQSFRQGHHQAAHMLATKHFNNYMVFNLSEPRRAVRSQHERVREAGWPPGLAPPLERLCSICKDIETWLAGGNNRIAVLHARGSRERIGVVVAAFMHYSSICGTADQALDRFAMRKYLDDKVGELEQPSNRRYLEYFSGLLSGNIRVNSQPLYLTHVTVLGAPIFEPPSPTNIACRAFLKIYEGLVPVYTSNVHLIASNCRQFVVNIAGDRRKGLQLHGDILLKAYHYTPTSRHLIFACQFHTCAISDYTLILPRSELDSACHDLRFPSDGAVELHFSEREMNSRMPLPAPTPAVPVEVITDAVVGWDSCGEAGEDEDDEEGDDDLSPSVLHTYGPLDGSIYATISKKSPSPPSPSVAPRTVSMDSGISSAGNGLQPSNASSTPPAPPKDTSDTHRALDELLREMLVTVEGIPDLVVGETGLAARRDIAFIDEDIPYHARQDSQPFTYGQAPGPEMLRGQPGLSSPSLVRKASFGKSQSNGFASDLIGTKNTSWSSRASEASWTTPRNSSKSWEPPTSMTDSFRWRSVKTSHDSHDGLPNGTSSMLSLTPSSTTWLQRQQQKLRERREAALRSERRYQESRLISELRAHASASHRDGYTSDTTHFADDDDDEEDLMVPLHVQTERRFGRGFNQQRKFADTSIHSESTGLLSLASCSPSSTAASVLVNGTCEAPPGFADETPPQPENDTLNNLIASLSCRRDSPEFSRDSCTSNLTNSSSWPIQLRDESLSSWRTASVSDDPGSPSRTNSPRPVTPAFPVHPRTPYSNQSVQFELNGLPPKSPTAQRRLGVKGVRRSPSTTSKDRSPSPGLDNAMQSSPKSTASSFNGSYQPSSQRSSVGSEPPQEVSPVHVKFVKDTSKFWYRPTISREEAINMLRNEPPGTFVVRDSNSFPGAFGLAVKVATPPPGKTGKPGSDELVRHFLIEPTSRGVRLKGCVNEPVFSSLSALVYQHSITNMALPTRLVLPQVDRRVEPTQTSSNHQLLQQGAACNVLYLLTVDTESLTGPQAIRKAVDQLFHSKPLPVATLVHFKVSIQGVTLTDNKRQLFFRRHYPLAAISHCGLDPDDHRWSHSTDSSGVPISSQCFGFVARKPASKTDNQCHVFAELEPEQPASAIVNFVNKVMLSGSQKPNML